MTREKANTPESDQPEQDRDVLIQQHSAGLIAELGALGTFLRRADGRVRSRVPVRDCYRLVSQVLEPFQELPQLLDPHLPGFLTVLAEAYLEYLQTRRRPRSRSRSRSRSRAEPGAGTRSALLMPLSDAICQILYAFCKIRGEKVVVRFLNVETRYLELLLRALDDAERRRRSTAAWEWQQRYVVLLWLSQLMLAPFDLSTVSSSSSSGEVDDAEDRPVIAGLDWPAHVPGIALRVVPLAVKYLAAAGKERDGAKALLVRTAMRRDMQEIGLLSSLVRWAVSTLQPRCGAPEPEASTYSYIGSLAFLAGLLGAAAEASMMDPYLTSIYHATLALSSGEEGVLRTLHGSALARKTAIKVIRSIVTLVLCKRQPLASESSELVENSIGYLLESLADKDTPVRFAASKALSIVTFKLEPDMAGQVVDAVLEALNRKVLWVRTGPSADAPMARQLSAVDALEWHGLMLTLSHLLYRRSPPPEKVGDIIVALLMGLDFEQRGPSGASIGTNVRDAACFGIWAAARRYTTAELLAVVAQPVAGQTGRASVLQVIATALVVAGSLDPAGNIRRASSAALQELVGRHPDTIEKGIALVQTVDYHAVALRSRAIHQVALQATQLSAQYGLAFLHALLGWRGVGDMEGTARRVAGSSFASLTAEIGQEPSSDGLARFEESVKLLVDKMASLQLRQVEERHGLISSLAAVYDLVAGLVQRLGPAEAQRQIPTQWLLQLLNESVQDCQATVYRKPELVAEAVSRLVLSSCPVLLLHLLGPDGTTAAIVPGHVMVEESRSDLLMSAMSTVDEADDQARAKLEQLLAGLEGRVGEWLDSNDMEVIAASSKAAMVLLLFSHRADRSRIIRSWSDKVCPPTSARSKHGNGYYHALARAFHLSSALSGDGAGPELITAAFQTRWGRETEIEERVAILQSIADRDVLRERAGHFVPLICDGLDDYTTNARGDIGSHVRLEAIKATRTLWSSSAHEDGRLDRSLAVLFPPILRLAAEKLDRVRVQARSALGLLLRPSVGDAFCTSSFSSKAYFDLLLGLCTADAPLQHQTVVARDWTLDESVCMSSLLCGLATSADTGHVELVIASRAAVVDFCRAEERDGKDGKDGKEGGNLSRLAAGLLSNLERCAGQDRVLVPTLELLAFLFHVGILPGAEGAVIDLRRLCLLTQRAGYGTGNFRKIEACIKVYGGVASSSSSSPSPSLSVEIKGEHVDKHDTKNNNRGDAVQEAKRRLAALLLHPWPKVRALVVDTLWCLLTVSSPSWREGKDGGRAEKLMGVDWGRADKSFVKGLSAELGLC